MSIRHNILEAIDSSRDEFYYKCNDIEQELFALKAMTDNKETVKKLEAMIVEFNNIRMEEYRKDSIVEKYINLPYHDFKATNTIGQLKDGRLFVVPDDNVVMIVNDNISLDEFKDKLYTTLDDQEYWEEYSSKFERCENDIEGRILSEVGRD